MIFQISKRCLFPLVLASLLHHAEAAEPGGGTRPDILFILIDDLRWDSFSFMGHPYVKTPNIDRLRNQGVLMENAFCTTSLCCPSRATFITGTYASRHGVIDNEGSEYNPDVTPPLTKYLQQAGYKTAMLGKWHMGHTAAPRPFFDYWVSFKGQGKYFDPLFNINGKKVQDKGYTTDILTDKTIGFIKSQPTNQPYFCMLSHKAVHEPFEPAPRHEDAFGSDRMDLEPVSWSEDLKGKPAWQRRQRMRDTRWAYRTRDYENEQLPDRVEPDPWVPHNYYTQQLRCLLAVDDGIGKILAALKARGTLNNTLIFFTSDNGYFHMEHHRGDKRLAYEESMRIPMILAYPGRIKPGSSVPQLVSSLDFAPTVLSYAGVPVPRQMQGLSMKPLLERTHAGPSSNNRPAVPQWRDSLFYEYWVELVHEIPTMTAVRTDRYKLIRYPEINDLDELYDLKTDPHELDNLAASPEYAQLHRTMQQLLKKKQKEAGWRLDAFPRNLPRCRGSKNLNLELVGHPTTFSGKGDDIIQVPYKEDADPSSWPWRIDIDVKPESDGVIASQASPRYGFTIFIQDGRPGLAVQCKTWTALYTVLDAPESVLGQKTKIQASIDYNRVIFKVDGKLIESRRLPQAFNVRTRQPLIIGGAGGNPVCKGIPDNPFKGEILKLTIQRGSLKQP